MTNTMNVLQLIKDKKQKENRQKQAQMVNVRIAKCTV
jgi:hypothetical protein